MNPTRRRLSRLTIPLKALVDRFAFSTLLVLSVALLVLAKADVRAVNFLGARIVDVFTPVMAMLSEPIAATQRAASDVGEMIALHDENARLREQNRRLLAWQARYHGVATENLALRRILNVASEPPVPTSMSARVIADGGGAFVQTRLVDAGRGDGVVKGMAVINELGLIGRVIDVGERSARILLVTDFNSRVPVMVVASGDHAVLAGDNSSQPYLMFLPLNPRLAVGDRVVTSGEGGLLPRGLSVGLITQVSEGHVEVAPLVDRQRLDFVRLLDFPQVPAPEQELPAAPPIASAPIEVLSAPDPALTTPAGSDPPAAAPADTGQ